MKSERKEIYHTFQQRRPLFNGNIQLHLQFSAANCGRRDGFYLIGEVFRMMKAFGALVMERFMKESEKPLHYLGELSACVH